MLFHLLSKLTSRFLARSPAIDSHEPPPPRDMTSYRAYIDKIAASGEGGPLLTATPEGMPIIVARLFDLGRREALILTTDLPEAIYGRPEALEAIGQFLERNSDAKIRILHEQPIAENNALLKFITERAFLDRLELSRVHAEKISCYKIGFLLVDDEKVRFQPDRAEPDAFANFNNPTQGRQLRELFHQIAA